MFYLKKNELDLVFPWVFGVGLVLGFYFGLFGLFFFSLGLFEFLNLDFRYEFIFWI